MHCRNLKQSELGIHVNVKIMPFIQTLKLVWNLRMSLIGSYRMLVTLTTSICLGYTETGKPYCVFIDSASCMWKAAISRLNAFFSSGHFPLPSSKQITAKKDQHKHRQTNHKYMHCSSNHCLTKCICNMVCLLLA